MLYSVLDPRKTFSCAPGSNGWPIGLCSWCEAVEYFAGPLVPQPEYERITRNYVPVNRGSKFTVCRQNEYPLLEIWKCGHAPNISEGWAVIRVDEAHCLVRVGPPRGLQFHPPGVVSCEALVERSAIDRLLEPLKTMRPPVVPGEDESVFILDGATHGFEARLGGTRFSYEWHTMAPAGWEPFAESLHETTAELERLLL